MSGQQARVLGAWSFLAFCVAGTILDPLLFATSEPKHVLILSWGAMDISAVQVLIAVLTRKEVKEREPS